MDSRDRSPVQVQHMLLPHLLSSPEPTLQSMPEQTTEVSIPPTESTMSTTEQETVPVSTAPVAAGDGQATDAPAPVQEPVPADNETEPEVVLQETSASQPQTTEVPPSETSPQPQQPDSADPQALPQTTDQSQQPTEITPVQVDGTQSEPAPPAVEVVSSPEAESTDHPTSTPPETTTTTGDPQALVPVDSQPADPEPAPPPSQPDVPEWATWEDDLTTPDEEELEEVKDEEVERDATNIAAKEKQVFTDHDDPDQRPVKKIRLSWIIKGVRGTRERPNRARTMNSPAAYVDGLYWSIKFFPRGNKSSSVSAYIQCSKEKPQPDTDVPESTFTYFEGPPDADLGPTAEPIGRIRVEATPIVKTEEKVNVEDTNKEASASNDNSQSEDEIKPAAEVTLTEKEKDFRCSAQLGMVLYNPDEPRSAICHTSEHQFCPKNCDWGWTNFYSSWNELHKRKRGQRQALLKNDTVGIDAYIRVFDDPTEALWWHGSHDNESNWPSKLLAGYFPMGTPPLYHSPAVAGMTTWLLLAPFRDVLQNVNTAGWRKDSQIKPRAFISRLQIVLHQMRHMKSDDYVNVHPAIEVLRDCGESYNDVKGFWEAFRRGIELELEGETEALQKFAQIFDVEEKRYTMPALPVRGVGDVQTALSMIQQPAGLPASGPDFLPLSLEREAFDKISREWKMHYDRVTLNEEITLPFGDNTKYSLYGFVVHVGTRNSGRFYSILRPNGPKTKWLAFEDGDGNKVFSYTRKDIQEYEGLVGDELDNFNSTRQTAYMALYIKTDRLEKYLPGSLESYVAPQWLKKAYSLDSDCEASTAAKDDVPPKTDCVAFEVYHDACAVGRRGLLDMFNVKQFSGNRGSFRSWALPSKTTIGELREQLAISMGLDGTDRLRVFGMGCGEVGQYGNAMWSQLNLETTLGSLATDVRPLCLWTSTLETDEDVKLFKMRETAVTNTPVEDDSSDEDEPSPPTLDDDARVGSGEEAAAAADPPTEPAVVPSPEAGAEPPTDSAAQPSTESAVEVSTESAIQATTEPLVTESVAVVEPAAQPGPESAAVETVPGQSDETVIEASRLDMVAEDANVEVTPAQESSVSPQAEPTPDQPIAETTVTTSQEVSALPAGPTSSEEAPSAEPTVTEAQTDVVPSAESEAVAVPESTVSTEEQTTDAQPDVPPQIESAEVPQAENIPDQPTAETVAPSESAPVAEVPVAETLEEPLPVEHGHLVDAMISNPESTDGPAVVQQVINAVAEAPAAPPQENISPEDEAAIAALIAEDAAALTGETSQVSEAPVADISPPEGNDAVPTLDEVLNGGNGASTTPDSTEQQESDAPKPCVYGFIQRFDPENQTFEVSRTFFAPRDAPVRAYIRKLLKYEEGQSLHIWYRTTAVTGAAVGENETFTDIHFIDGVDLIIGPVLSDETITEMRTAGKFWEPFGLSGFLRMQERKHPEAITTKEGEEVEINEFGGQYYKGPLVNGRQHGASCQIIYANGQTYSGPLRCNLRHGSNGKMLYQNGDAYEGEWQEDEQHGQGTFTQKRTSNKYVGGFMNGKRWGKGTTFWEVADEEADLCQICYGEEIDALFFDCGHVCSCVECAKQCESCPICRRSVRQVVKMYRV